VKRNTVVIALFVILAGLLIAYFYFGRERKKRYSWRENYKAESDQPYGTLFIRQLLEYQPETKFIYNTKTPLVDLLTSDSVDFPASYIFVGTQLSLTVEDSDELLRFIHSGNDAFVAVRHLPWQLVDSIFYAECENEIYFSEHVRPSATMNFYHPSLKKDSGYAYAFKPGSQTRSYRWSALQPGLFCDSTRALVALGHFENDAVNFFKLPFGEGNLYIHTNPLLFTNYFMRMEDKAEYASKVFSHLDASTIIWDEYSRAQFIPTENESNPLALIMQHESLKYAWWMMLATAVLYTVFTAKRKQRIVPIREEKVNTSLEYVKMVSALHFENGNNKDIAMKKMKYFFYFIRAKYGIPNGQLTQEHYKKLAAKSQIALEHIESIFFKYGQIERNVYNSTDAHELISLYNAIDHFYKHCK
jgi:hypothetical protein